MSSLRYVAWISIGLMSLACANDDESPTAGSAVTEEDLFAGCSRDKLESDIQAMPLAGPGVRNGALTPGEYLIATTYLQLRPGVGAHFDEVGGPVVTDIVGREGFVALAFANSRECGTARTLTVWRDEMAMLKFVVGDAHARAMAAVGELSRGGSMAAQWLGDQDTVSWDSAARHLATSDREMY